MTTDNRFFNDAFSVPLGSLGRSPTFTSLFASAKAGFYGVQLELDALNGRGVQFQNLANVPTTITALKYLRGNAAANALEYVSGANIAFKTISGTSYTLLTSDAGLCLETSNASAVSITVPPNASAAFETGDVVIVAQNAAGQITFVPGSGVTISSSDSSLKTRGTQAQVALHYRGADAWRLIGERELAALAYASLVVPNQFTSLQAVTSVALTDATTITTNAALGNNFRVTLGGNRTLGNPTNMTDGAILNWKIKQDGTGSRTLAYGSKFKWAGGTAPTLSTAASSRDFITAQYFSDEDILVAAIMKGLA